jgi:predicted Mrr-cat superfamily restriction endonuclease
MVELANLNLSDGLAHVLTRQVVRRFVEKPDGFELAEFVGGVLETFGLHVYPFILSHPRAGDFTACDGPLGLGPLQIRGRVVRGREVGPSDVEVMAAELQGDERGILVAWDGYSHEAWAAIQDRPIRLLEGDYILDCAIERYDQLEEVWRNQIPLATVRVPTMELVNNLPD